MNSRRRTYANIGSSYPAILDDGNTIAWYDFTNDVNITKDNNNLVSQVNDISGNNNHLSQLNQLKKPLFSDGCLSFDGINDYMTTSNYTRNQPDCIYIVVKKIGNNNSYIFDSLSFNTMMFSDNFGFQIRAGNALGGASIRNQFIYVKTLYNGNNSLLEVNNNKSTGSAGTANSSGLTIGCAAQYWAGNGNIEVKELINRKIVDTVDNDLLIKQYLINKHDIVM